MMPNKETKKEPDEKRETRNAGHKRRSDDDTYEEKQIGFGHN